MTATLTVLRDGYSKPYVARLTGRDPEWGFRREWQRPTVVHRNRGQRASSAVSRTYRLRVPGIYEARGVLGRSATRCTYWRFDGSELREVSLDSVRMLIRDEEVAS